MEQYQFQKTFQKGDAIPDILDFVMSKIETNDYQPEGTHYSSEGLSPHDPVSELKFKYVVTIRKIV